MEQTAGALLEQGLIVTALGMGLVFMALGVLWGIMTLLTRVFRPEPAHAVDAEGGGAIHPTVQITPIDDAAPEDLVAERARAAAAVAAVLKAGAVPPSIEVPIGPAFEHGRTAPIWVSANRARVLASWHPPRTAEFQPTTRND